MPTMLTLYYLVKKSKKAKTITQNTCYTEQFQSTQVKHNSDLTFKCRICLSDGIIPIYGSKNTPNVSEAIIIFSDISLSENDKYPKMLCIKCFNFLREALVFRKIAKETDEILKKPVKEENIDYKDTSHDNFSDTPSEENTDNWKNEDNINEIKNELKKVKYIPKITCQICNKVINRSYYKEHMTMHDPDHKKYVCDVCGKSFRLRCAYHNHSLRHRTDFPYKCQFCQYRGRYAELLKTHMRTHTGDYRYMCTECPARFLFKSNLNSHMLKHKEPQYKCDACKRAFHTKLAQQRHFEADHLGIKNHVCNICGKAFGYRNAMMKHQRHVHKREKFLYGRMPAYLEFEHSKQNL